MRKIWLALLVSTFLLALTAVGASAADGPAFSTDGVAVNLSQVSSYMRYDFPLTVTESGKVTFRFYGGTLSVLDSVGRGAAWKVGEGTRSMFLHAGAYTARVVSGYASAAIQISATVEKLPADAEPNDTASTAQQVSLPGSLGGIIGTESDKDYFKFTVGARTGMTFKVTSQDSYFPVSFSLRSAGDAALKNLTATPTVALDPGNYYLTMSRGTSDSFYVPYTTAYEISASAFRCVDSLTVSPAEASLEVKQTRQLSLTALPANHEEAVTVQSSNPSVATVTSAGLVKAVKPGTVTIWYTVPSGASAKAVITVLKPEATSYKLPKTCKATIGFSYRMSDWLSLPSGTRAPSGLTWSSAQKSVASITTDGTVTCNKPGTAKITAVNRKGKKFATKLTVIPNQLNNTKPKGKSGYLSSYPKRVYYQGGFLYIEVFLYNNTKYNLRDPDASPYNFELYDLAKSAKTPIYRQVVDWDPGRIKKHSWKVFKIQLPRGPYDNCDLGLGQLYPLIYSEGDFYIVKSLRIGEPVLSIPRTGALQ